MKNSNLTLRNCLVESFLFEDDNDSKAKKVAEGIKKWLEDTKEKLKEIIKKFTEKVLNVFKKIKAAPAAVAAKVPVTKANRIKKLEKEISEYKNDLTKLSSKFNALQDKVFGSNGEKLGSSDKFAVNLGSEEADEIKAKIDKRIEKLAKLKGDDVKEDGKDVDAKGYEGAKNRVFGIYKQTVGFIVKEIKSTIGRVGKLIKACEDLSKKGVKVIGAGVKAVGKSFSYIFTNIKAFAVVTSATVKAGVLSKFDKKEEDK